MSLTQTVDQIRQLYIESGDGLDASSYEVIDLCDAVEDASNENKVLREALKTMLKSAVPHPVEHPTMTAAWKTARAALSACDEGVK